MPGGTAVTTEDVPSTGHTKGPTAEASLPLSTKPAAR